MSDSRQSPAPLRVKNSPPVHGHAMDMALYSMSAQIQIVYFSREEERSLSRLYIILPSSQINSLSTIFKCHSWFSDLVQCIMNYTLTFELEYSVQFLQAQSSDVALIIQLHHYTLDTRPPSCGCYTPVAKIFLKNQNFFTSVAEQ